MKYHASNGDQWDVVVEPPEEGPYYIFRAFSPEGYEVVTKVDSVYFWMQAIAGALAEEIEGIVLRPDVER